MTTDFPQDIMEAEERFYALQEFSGRVSTHWGKPKSSGEESLHFQKFHFPRTKNATIWRDFHETATWALSENSIIKHRDLKDSPHSQYPRVPGEAGKAGWALLCKMAEVALQSDVVQKLVPARKVSLPIAPGERRAILESISGRLFFPPLENSYRFLVKSRSSYFFGATPELLFLREGGEILVPAIAGTRALAPGVPESTLREELLSSEKDRAEHAWVVDGIRESLQKIGFLPKNSTEPQVVRVPRLLHLYTPITVTDNPAISSEALIECLHPTPAIAGHPRAAALDFLYENEDWDRGLYSAPLLFRSPEREICLVAIRSALLTMDHVHFFAGAGYVRGSHPDSEWDETEKKIQVMQTILFGERHGKK